MIEALHVVVIVVVFSFFYDSLVKVEHHRGYHSNSLCIIRCFFILEGLLNRFLSELIIF